MKKIFFAAFIFLFLPSFCFTPVVAAENNMKSLRVGVYDNYPKIYKDDDGTIKGFWVDITNYIAEKENWDLTYVYGSWDQGLARLEKGEIDMMVDVATSKEREQIYDFNNQTALNSWGVFYTKDGIVLNSFMDLKDKNIAIMKSGILYAGSGGLVDILSSLGISAEIINVDVYSDVFELLDSGQADVGVVNWFYGVANEDQYKVNRTGIIFQPTELKYALTKNGSQNSYLISVLDFNLQEIKQDKNSIYYKSIDKYFGMYLGQVEVLPNWWNIFLISLGAFLVLIVVGLFIIRKYQKTLKREIAKKIKEIKEDEEKYSAVVNQAQDGIVIVQDQIVKYANKAISIIGYTDTEVVGKPFINLIAPEEQEKIAKIYKNRIAGETVDTVYETKLKHKNGSIIEAEFSSGVIQYGNQAAVLVMVRDLTGRKKMEKEIVLRNTILSTELEVAIDGVLVVDEHGKILLYNHKFIEMWDISKEIIDTKSDKLVIKSVFEKLIDPKEFTERVKYLYDHPKETDRSEVRLTDGRIFDRYSAPMIDSAQRNYGRVWYFRDISESKKLEIRLKELDTLKTKFIQIVSHQLRTPLNVSRWNIESILSGSHGPLKATMEGLLHISLDANVEVINRIGDLLTALDIEENRLANLNKTSISIESLLESVMVNFKVNYEIKNIKYSYLAPKSPLPELEIDADKIRSTLEKLVDNAITYTKEKGKITTSLKEIENGIRFEITDTGVGIPKSEQKNIGTRFYRASNATAMKPDASGLGLFIAKYFIEQHGGKFGFESIEGKGSTVWFELPIITSPNAKQ